MAPLSQEVEKITLDITAHSTLYTDAAQGIMLQRSGGLENSKFFHQTKQTPFTHQKDSYLVLENTRISAAAFLIYKEVTSLLTNIPQEEEISIARNAIYGQFSKETFSVILKRTLCSNGICQSLPDIMKKTKDAKASLSHSTTMEEMNKSNKVIT